MQHPVNDLSLVSTWKAAEVIGDLVRDKHVVVQCLQQHKRKADRKHVAVEPVQEPAMAGKRRSEVFNLVSSFQTWCEEACERRHHRNKKTIKHADHKRPREFKPKNFEAVLKYVFGCFVTIYGLTKLEAHFVVHADGFIVFKISVCEENQEHLCEQRAAKKTFYRLVGT